MSFIRKLVVAGSVAGFVISMTGCSSASWLHCGPKPPPPVEVPPAPEPEPTPAPAMCNSTSVYFDTDMSDVRPEGATALQELADCLAKNDQKVEIKGYADLRYTVPYNLALSQRRADSVVAFLTSKGLVKERIISAVGQGETEQFGAGRSPENLQKNRVVVVEIRE